MEESFFTQYLLYDVFVILTAGFLSGIICRRIGMPMVVGYLIVGALIGPGMFSLLTSSSHPPTPTINIQHETPSEQLEEIKEIRKDEQHIIEGLALLGANLLLFAVGIHFSPSELSRIWRFFIYGGSVQMLGVILPAWLVGSLVLGDWKVGLMIGAAVSLSSTVLVFKSLDDFGQSASPHGMRAVAILLFQDVMVVPLLVLLGFLTAIHATTGESMFIEIFSALAKLLWEAFLFTAFVATVRWSFIRWGVDILQRQKSVELLVLFTFLLIIGVTSVGLMLSLPSALGALAAGFILSETRLTKSIAAITVPMRETFSTVFFVSLGALFTPQILWDEPLSTLTLLALCLGVKTLSAACAFRILGLTWIPSLAMGMGISQLGELSFILLSQGSNTIDPTLYKQVLFVAMASMILTPFLLKLALQWSSPHLISEGKTHSVESAYPDDVRQRALVIGLGPVGARLVSFLEMSGFDVCLVDMNPVNLHAYAQQGFRTVAGNATDPSVLQIARLHHCTLVVVTVPNDQIAQETVQVIRQLNKECIIVVRCHYTMNVRNMEAAGGHIIICEESEAGIALVQAVQRIVQA